MIVIARRAFSTKPRVAGIPAPLGLLFGSFVSSSWLIYARFHNAEHKLVRVVVIQFELPCDLNDIAGEPRSAVFFHGDEYKACEIRGGAVPAAYRVLYEQEAGAVEVVGQGMQEAGEGDWFVAQLLQVGMELWGETVRCCGCLS